jgi:putative NIF3 family GTP cyclohydrolase 1 type 2
MKREELTRYLDETLDAGRFRDYCPNGLQVEGRPKCSAWSPVSPPARAARGRRRARAADAILVHHGWFWRGEDGRVTGLRKTRLQTLLQHDINLIAYHLPLDSHPEFGNNAQLARRLGWIAEGRFGEQDIGWLGVRLEKPMTARGGATRCCKAAARAAAHRRRRAPGQARRLVFGRCAGLFRAGHRARRRPLPERRDLRADGASGARIRRRLPGRRSPCQRTLRRQALAEHLAERFGLDCQFVDIDNPV